MTTARQYVAHMWARQRQIAIMLGSDLGMSGKDVRVSNKAGMALLAVVVKTLVDKGVIADQDVLDTLEAAKAELWPEEPWQPPGDT